MSKPNIQIDDLVREMTDEEYALWLETTKDLLLEAPTTPE
jgi:hypothetical protein